MTPILRSVVSGISAIAPALAGIIETAVPGSKLAIDAISAVAQAVTGNPQATHDDIAQAIQLGLPADTVVKLAQANNDMQVRLAKIASDAEGARLAAENQALAAVNETMREEDRTRRFSWRDYWGYISGTGFGATVAIVGYIVEESVRTAHPEQMAAIPAIVGSFATLFGIAATVLGVHAAIETHHAGMTDRIEAQKGASA